MTRTNLLLRATSGRVAVGAYHFNRTLTTGSTSRRVKPQKHRLQDSHGGSTSEEMPPPSGWLSGPQKRAIAGTIRRQAEPG
jgi:hypothetical protein